MELILILAILKIVAVMGLTYGVMISGWQALKDMVDAHKGREIPVGSPSYRLAEQARAGALVFGGLTLLGLVAIAWVLL